MANFKKFLAGTIVTAAAAICGVAVYKKLQENKASNDDFDDFDDFEDDDFDDDFDDLAVESRNYTSIPADAVIATEEDDNTTQTEETPSVNASSDNATDSQTEENSYSYNAYSAYKKEDYSMDNTFYTRGSY